MYSDTLSFLTHSTLPLAKTWKADGTIADYAKPKNFELELFTVDDIHNLSAILTVAEHRPNTCLIRGKYIGDTPQHTLRRKDVFVDQPLHTILVEIDKHQPNGIDPIAQPVEAIEAYILNALPEAFHGVSYHWQLSNSAGHISKAGLLKAHVWFWLKTPYTSAQLRAWAHNNDLIKTLDVSVFDPIQVHYTAAPVFDPGTIDPVPMRSGFVEGLAGNAVDLILDEESLASVDKQRPPRTEGTDITDPIATWLYEQGLVKDEGPNQQLLINCPFVDSHTDGKQGTSDTTYLPAGTGGYSDGVFHCSHASCSERESAEFESALGAAHAFFKALPLTPDSPASSDKLSDNSTAGSNRFDVILASEYIKRPRTEWIIKGVLPKAGLALIYGGSGDGKTFATIDLCMAVARGSAWNRRKVRQGKIVYVCAESAGGFIDRVNAYSIGHETSLDSIPFGIIPATPNFRSAEDVKAIAAKVNAFGKTDIIVVDTLAQVTPGADENTAKDMSLVLRHCQELHRMTGALVLLVHHAGKDPNKGARGWSGLKAPLDAEFEVSRQGDTRRFWVEKLKDGRDSFGWDFNLFPVNIAFDSDGDVIDSCIVKFTRGANTKLDRKKPALRGKNETVVYDAATRLGPGAVTLPSLVDECMKFMPPTAPGKRDKRYERIIEALNNLSAKGELHYEGGIISAPL